MRKHLKLTAVLICMLAPSAYAAPKKAPEASEKQRLAAASKHLTIEDNAVAVYARGLC